MPVVAPRHESIQYDGTNGAHIAGTWSTAITFISDNGTTFVFRDGDNGNINVAVGSWLVRSYTNDPFPVVHTNTVYLDRWVGVS